jgi:hypothetical protein
MVRLEPPPSAASREEAWNTESFGSFNLVYKVQREAELFRDWTQFRFEHHPLMSERSYPRWFALPFEDVARQMLLLHAMGLYQHERRPLDDAWLKALLEQLL